MYMVLTYFTNFHFIAADVIWVSNRNLTSKNNLQTSIYNSSKETFIYWSIKRISRSYVLGGWSFSHYLQVSSYIDLMSNYLSTSISHNKWGNIGLRTYKERNPSVVSLFVKSKLNFYSINWIKPKQLKSIRTRMTGSLHGYYDYEFYHFINISTRDYIKIWLEIAHATDTIILLTIIE